MEFAWPEFRKDERRHQSWSGNTFVDEQILPFLIFFSLFFLSATIRLLEQIIPEFATYLNTFDSEVSIRNFRLVEEMHRRGIKFDLIAFQKKKQNKFKSH
jgi:hypothetical protein